MKATRPLQLIDNLNCEQKHFWNQANRRILWGWKRDVPPQSRLVYFAGDIKLVGNSVWLERMYFHYRSVIRTESAGTLLHDLEDCAATFRARGEQVELSVARRRGMIVAELAFGQATRGDEDRTRRLKLRRPRKRIVEPQFPGLNGHSLLKDSFPADLYMGSGVSYEAGLPTLCDMHDAFAVDCPDIDGFMVGGRDWLPRALADNPDERLRKFCGVHTGALLAAPTPAMRRISDLVDAGAIRRIFTDNVDNLLSKVNVPFERVRGSGVFNERYEADFASPNLIVVGVAADRRQIVRQARARKMTVIVVNPCRKVSPNVTHLDYLRRNDVFHKMEAHRFFQEVTQ